MPGISQNPQIAGVVLTEQAAAPAAPSSGKRKLYVGTDGGLRLEDSASAVTVIGAAVIGNNYNLLTNPGVEVWSRGSGPFATTAAYNADRFYFSIGGSSTFSISRDGTNQDTGSQYCAAITYTHNAVSSFQQAIEGYVGLRGRTVTLTARVRASLASAARLALNDGAAVTYSSYHTGGGVYETLTVTATVGASATTLLCQLQLGATGTYYTDNWTLVTGSSAMAYSPLTSADDLARCQRYYAEYGGLDVSEWLPASAQAYTTTTALAVLAYPVEMAIAPTVSISAPGDWAVLNASGGVVACTALSATAITRRSCRLSATVAAGLIAGNATLVQANGTLAA